MNWTPQHLAVPQPQPPRRAARTRLVGAAGAAAVAVLSWFVFAAAPASTGNATPWAAEGSNAAIRAAANNG